MRRSIALLAPALLLAGAMAQQQLPANSQPPQCPRYLPFGLRGRVHTLLTKTQQLSADPRPTSQAIEGDSHLRIPRLSATGGSPTWLSFDENERLVEQGTVSPDAKFASLTRTEGNTSVTTVKLPNQSTETIERRRVGNGGASSTDVYRNGKLTEKMESTIHNTGNGASERGFEQKAYDVEGKLLSESETQIAMERESNNRTVTTTTRRMMGHENGQSEERKSVDRFDTKHQLTEHTEYDANGTMICSFRFSGIALAYSMISSETKRPCIASVFSHEESKRYQFALYPNRGAGELSTEIWSYSDLQRVMEPESVERLDASGSVIDKVSFRYERDTQGNWTTRVVSVLDPASKALVDIQRDTRTITYYDQQ